MLWNFDTLRGCTLHATDGHLGRVHDMLFDDSQWNVRYLVVDTGSWLFGRRVLITPSVLGTPDAENWEIPVRLTQEQVRRSPSVDTDKPVSRQQETELHSYYGWLPYWASGGSMGAMGAPTTGLGALAMSDIPSPADPSGSAPRESADPHLRSARAVAGCTLTASDGDIGSVDSFLVDSDRWSVRWLVVDTGDWLPGRKVVIAPEWVRAIDWPERRATVSVTRAQVEGSPEYDPNRHMPREAEEKLFGWYGKRPYW